MSNARISMGSVAAAMLEDEFSSLLHIGKPILPRPIKAVVRALVGMHWVFTLVCRRSSWDAKMLIASCEMLFDTVRCLCRHDVWEGNQNQSLKSFGFSFKKKIKEEQKKKLLLLLLFAPHL